MMVGAKEAVLLLVVVICCGSTPGGALTDDTKMGLDGLEEAELGKNPQVSYEERKFKDGLTSDAEEEDGDDGEDEDDDEDATAAGAMTKLTGSMEKRKYAFRADLGKRSRVRYEPEVVQGIVEKRYRSFKADLGKRYSRFRSDLGKRLDGGSAPRSLGELENPEVSDGGRDDLGSLYLRPEKRPKFRADLGKRARYEASRRVFRADLGKRRMFRSDLG